MDVSALKAKIQSNQLPNYLIFSGDEWKVQQIYIDQIAKVTGRDVVRIDSITDIYSQLKNKSFLFKPTIYIVRDDKELMNSDKLQQQLDNGLLGKNLLIHVLTSVDKRTKFYKAYKDSIIEFEALSDAMLKKYILKEIKLSESNIQRLIDICEHDYGRILLEIDKIKRYKLAGELMVTDDYRVLEDDCFQMLLKDGTIYEPPYDAIFDLVDAILDRNVNKAFDLLEQAYEVGEATMVMLSVLHTNTKSLLQVQTYHGNEIMKATGLTGWQIKKARQHVGKFSDADLIYIVQLLQKVESGIKSGRMDEEFAMQYVLTHIM